MFIYTADGFHECHPMAFKTIPEIWSFVDQLKETGKLKSLLCCTAEGEIINEPCREKDIPGIIGQEIEGYSEPRSWTFVVESYAESIVHMIAMHRGNRVEYIMPDKNGIMTICWRHNSHNPKNWDSVVDYINRA
jgi:hypothetical protein